MVLSQAQKRHLPFGTNTTRFWVFFAQIERTITALNKINFALRAGDMNSICGLSNVLPQLFFIWGRGVDVRFSAFVFALAAPEDSRLFHIHICIGQIKLLKTRVGYQIITSSHKLLKMRVGYEMHQDC